MDQRTQIHLGASMYVPATRQRANLVSIGNGEKYPFLRSAIFCLEDSVRIDQLEFAVNNLRKALPLMEANRGPMRFIRVRNPEVLGRCLRMKGIQNVDGFVLPKITADNLPYYLALLSEQDNFRLMPTLETKEVFSAKEMGRLRDLFIKDDVARGRILCLRIGGNDLLHLLRVRRNPRRTIYDTPVGETIKRLAGEFIPYGFGLSAPVCESTNYPEVLQEEVELDLMQGLFGKTAIHPDQIQVIEHGFKVNASDLDEAHKIVDPDAAAVFKMNGRMCEPTTHTRWAEDIILRATIYGVRD